MPLAEWSPTFRLFSPTHAAVVLALLLGTAALVILRRRWADDPRARRLDRALAVAAGTLYLASNGWQLLPGNFSPGGALPLHVCDVTLLAVPFALWNDWRPARALLYFWGIGLSTQGFVTPDLQNGPATAGFWFFFLSHAAVVGGAAYDVIGRGYRPTWRDCRLAIFTGFAYLALVLAVDLTWDFNYGYVGRSTPGQPTLIDALGPWPGRVVIIVALFVAVTCLLQGAMILAERMARGRSGTVR